MSTRESKLMPVEAEIKPDNVEAFKRLNSQADARRAAAAALTGAAGGAPEAKEAIAELEKSAEKKK